MISTLLAHVPILSTLTHDNSFTKTCSHDTHSHLWHPLSPWHLLMTCPHLWHPLSPMTYFHLQHTLAYDIHSLMTLHSESWYPNSTITYPYSIFLLMTSILTHDIQTQPWHTLTYNNIMTSTLTQDMTCSQPCLKNGTENTTLPLDFYFQKIKNSMSDNIQSSLCKIHATM